MGLKLAPTLAPSGPSLRSLARAGGGPDALEGQTPLDLTKARGAATCVRDTFRFAASNSVSVVSPTESVLDSAFVATAGHGAPAAPAAASLAAALSTKTSLGSIPIATSVYPPSPPTTPEASRSLDSSTSDLDLLTPLDAIDVDPLAVPTFIRDVLTPKTLDHAAVVDVHVDALPWRLAVVADNVTDVRTLYVRSPSEGGAYEDVCLRENVVAVLDIADELRCEGVMICLEKSDPHLAQVLHSLLYVGGSVVDPKVVPHDTRAFLLVGLDI